MIDCVVVLTFVVLVWVDCFGFGFALCWFTCVWGDLWLVRVVSFLIVMFGLGFD